MAINKTHPLINEYTKKFNEIYDVYMKEREDARAEFPEWRGQDHPSPKLKPSHRKFSAAIKALQAEYHFLFTDD